MRASCTVFPDISVSDFPYAFFCVDSAVFRAAHLSPNLIRPLAISPQRLFVRTLDMWNSCISEPRIDAPAGAVLPPPLAFVRRTVT
ncbi:hypothetical protein PQX77_009431 [Marasmius sp. AFHP31]|nr:hypothetical protein PQX77_015911 [Marasmius sp. AFHP31]KAK1227564.1 hypothetical protein PQX77_009431 [Marasmius sp. AFHP31]